ncbi:HisA/HisF-related TIM barrel protein [Thermodesulfobacteriota bacterium]
MNCIDKDGTNSGFDIELTKQISDNISIPVIASGGAGCVEHFSEVFAKTYVKAAVAAGIFQREEVAIKRQ